MKFNIHGRFQIDARREDDVLHEYAGTGQTVERLAD